MCVVRPENVVVAGEAVHLHQGAARAVAEVVVHPAPVPPATDALRFI